MSARVEVLGVAGMPEVVAGDDLAALVQVHVPSLADGDVVVVTSKVVSKAEGRVSQGDRAEVIVAETERVVARRGPTTIARTRHGLTLAAAGVDASNTEPGTVVLLPEDPDASARRIRTRLRALTGRNVAVVLSDTAGRAWREGQTEIAVGCAGLPPLDDHAGRLDPHGNPLSVTAPALPDEVATAAELVMGKLSARPVAVVRGIASLVLPSGNDGPGAAALLRDPGMDMFVLGAREAVVAAVRRDGPDLEALVRSGADAARRPLHDLLALTGDGSGDLVVRDLEEGLAEVSGPDDVPTAAALERLCVLAVAHGRRVVADERNLGRCRIVVRSGPGGP